MNKPHIRKKAFTLTELLVVVIVIGVLSAIVLPKFSKVVETRKTTEAEDLMSAVRTEQEKRCALDKNYLSELNSLADIVPDANSKNFSYSLTTTGMEAQSKGKYGYTLKMPSYRDGRICCENETECAKLNKDYPLCSTLMARADYQSGNECAGDSPDVPPEPEPEGCENLPSNLTERQACGGNFTGEKERHFNTQTCTWGNWDNSSCQCSLSAQSEACGEGYTGNKTRGVNSAACEYEPWDTSACEKEVDVCAEKPTSPSEMCRCVVRGNASWTLTEYEQYMLCQMCPPYMQTHQAQCCAARGGVWNSPKPGCWSKTYSYSQSGSYRCGYPCLLYDGHCGVAMSERRSQGCRPDGGKVCPSNNSCSAAEVGQECYYCVTRPRTDVGSACSHSTYVYSKICAATEKQLF